MSKMTVLVAATGLLLLAACSDTSGPSQITGGSQRQVPQTPQGPQPPSCDANPGTPDTPLDQQLRATERQHQCPIE